MTDLSIQHIVYADESGTGVKRDRTDPVPTLAGWIDVPSNWERFKFEWQTVNNTFREHLTSSGFNPDHFHCAKIMARYAKDWRKMPWLPDYIHELAFVAARTAMPICSTNEHNDGEPNGDPTCHDDIKHRRNGLPSHFFETVLQEFKRTGKTGKALFVFESGDKAWNEQETAACFNSVDAFQKAGIEIITPCIASKHVTEHALPLQAADLLASVTRKAVKSPVEFSSHPLRFILCYRVLQYNYRINKQCPSHGPDGMPPTLPFIDFEPKMRAYLQRRLLEENAKLRASGDLTRTYCPFYGGICNPSEQT